MGWAGRCCWDSYPATSLLGLDPRLEGGAQWQICMQFLDLIKSFSPYPTAVKEKGGGLGLTNMSLLCFSGLASAVTSWPLPVLMKHTWGLSLGIDSQKGPPLPSYLMTNTDSPLPPPSHSFAFYQEGDNECTAIDFQGISAPRDRESIIWIRDTFLSLIN